MPAVVDATTREAIEAYRAASAGRPLREKLLRVMTQTRSAHPAPDAAVFVISVAAELTGLHPQTLRTYERMGLITPGRTGGGGRRYSPRDIELLREIAQLTSSGIGIEGVRRILELENRLAASGRAQRGARRRAGGHPRGAAPVHVPRRPASSPYPRSRLPAAAQSLVAVVRRRSAA